MPVHAIDPTGLSAIERKMARLEEELMHARAENNQLRERGMAGVNHDKPLPPELEHADDSKLKSALVRATRDIVSSIITFIIHCHAFNVKTL